MRYHSNPSDRPLSPAYRINRTCAKAMGTCRICGGLAVDFEDDSIRLEYEVFGFCPKCLDALFGFRQRRRYHRVPQRLRILYSSDMHLFHSGVSRDIGLGGVFILTDVRHSAGAVSPPDFEPGRLHGGFCMDSEKPYFQIQD
jgi:hypothetical protein